MSFEKKTIRIDQGVPLPMGAYSHAVQVGSMLYIAGQGARDPESNQEVGLTFDENGTILHVDIPAQTHQVIQNLQTILKAAGCTLHDVIEVNAYLANMADFDRYNQVYAEYFSFENPPARTTIEAKAPGHNFVEMKAIALCPQVGS